MDVEAQELLDLTQEVSRLSDWLKQHTLTPPEVDCSVAVMMKILDGKCKMPADEKVIMEALYLCIKDLPSDKLGHQYHQFIAPYANTDRHNISDEKILEIYEMRVLAETEISRPVMKKFKARLRQEGVLPPKN